MDYQEMVFNAAKDGDLHQLKEMLNGKSRKDVFSLVSARTNDFTPLIMACTNGHLDVALYLIESCNVDIDQVGSVTFDGCGIIKEAFPLWCASVAGHLSIVQMLVKYNAAVNSTMKDNSTALYAVCSYGQFEIAKFLIEHGADIEIADDDSNSCLMLSCWNGHYEISKYLLECGADINRKRDKGDTALHLCAKCGNLAILKLLLKNGAESFCDSYGTTPLLTAALGGHSQIVDYFICECICTKQDQVNAFELLGSFFIMAENSDKEKAFKYWKLAMELRYEHGKFPLEKPITRSPISSCVDTTEVHTLHQLEKLDTNSDEMYIQALLIADRIIGLGHPHVFSYIELICELYRVDGNYYRCKKLWMYALEEKLKIRYTLNQTIMIILTGLAEIFSFMMAEGSPLERGLQPALFQDILYVFEICLQINEADMCIPTAEKHDDWINEHHRFLITALHLVGLMCSLQPLNKEEDAKLKKAVCKLVCLNPRGIDGSTLLHLACSDASSPWDHFCVIEFPSTEVVDILLDVGACPNAKDESNNTPLHVVAMYRPFVPATFKSLVNHGAHLDFCNNERKTPLQLTEDIPSSDVYPMHYINLQCLCAQAIRKYEVPYVGFVPKRIKEFIDSH